jgi:D-alanine-D-alanine ligase
MRKKISVAILGGGDSNEREISLKTARQVAAALSPEKYSVLFIDVSKNNWIVRVKKTDVVFIALHGKNGEDGKIQAILDLLEVSYTGSGVLASALGMNKVKCNEFLRAHEITVPKSIALKEGSYFEAGDLSREIEKTIGYPCVVKPNESGSSIGISIVRNKRKLKSAVKKAFKEDETILIEEYISGREFTCGILGNTGGAELIILPPVEIITHSSEFFDYKEKYFSKTVEEICPANVSPKVADKIGKTAKMIHEYLGCKGLTRSDFILTDKNKLYFLEINTIPGQTEASLCPKEAKAIGWTFQEFIGKQIELALKKR